MSTILLILLFNILGGFICIGISMLMVFAKSKISKMNEAKWDEYFRDISTNEIIAKIFIIYLVALVLSSLMAYATFVYLGRDNALILACVTFAFGAITTSYKVNKRKDEFVQKCKKLKEI